MVGGDGGSTGGRFIIMEKTGDKLTKQTNQQSDLYNYNLDHVYCSDNSRYRTAGTHLNITAAASDLKALRKENKQLQAMLLLHLDLIQEQSNQLIAKDKQLIQLREENAQLRLKCERSPATANEQRRLNNVNTNNSSSSSSSSASTTNRQLNTANASAIATASTTMQTVGHRILNTSAGSPTIDTYFTTTSSHSDPKVSTIRTHQQHENFHPKFKTISNVSTLSNVLFNNNSGGGGGGNSGQIIINENQAVHEMRNSSSTNTTTTTNSQQTIYPTIKVEANAMPADDTNLIRKHVLNSVGPIAKDRYKVVTTTTTGGSANNSVKYRAIENNVIGHNNGKIISKIILQRKRSENGEKIFVRTKNIEIGSNNRVNYGKWSPLRTIKSEVIDNDMNENEAEPEAEIELALDTAVAAVADTTAPTTAATSAVAAAATSTVTTAPPSPAAETAASPNPNTTTSNDDEMSSDVPNTDYVLTPTSTGTPSMQLQSTTATSSHSLPPSSSSSASSTSSSIRSTLVEQSDASVSECQIDSIKIEQEIDDILDESNPHCMSFDMNSAEKLNDTQAEELGISPSYDGDGDGDGDGDEIDDDEDDPNTLNYSQDTSNIESPRASESMQCIPLSSSPVTSTSDYTHCDLFGGAHFDSNSSTQTGIGGLVSGGGGGGSGGGSVGLIGGGGVGAGSTGSTGASGGLTILYPMAKRHINRNAFLTTRKPYIIRDWQLDEIEAELKQEITDEICKEENEANLELPKWRTWELSSNRESPVPREYEDLSDDAFARRHARFLLDERKRKKWDVQRIREQRTIERLKRRHCKDELNQQKDMNKMFTFYPTVDQLKTIQITDDLPVSAFGEPIPLLPPGEFALPWHFNQTATANTTTSNANDCGVPLAVPPDYTSRPNSNSSSANPLEPFTPSNVSSIIFLSKRRSGRTRTSISHNQSHPNVKCIT